MPTVRYIYTLYPAAHANIIRTTLRRQRISPNEKNKAKQAKLPLENREPKKKSSHRYTLEKKKEIKKSASELAKPLRTSFTDCGALESFICARLFDARCRRR